MKPIVNRNTKPVSTLPLELPREIFEKIISHVNPHSDYIDISRTLSNLSLTCKRLHGFFHPQLNTRLSMSALIFVLRGDERNAVKLAHLHPEAFFIKNTAYDYARDLNNNHRIISDTSAYQAMFGTGDIDMILKIQPILFDKYLNNFSAGHQFSIRHLKEKFINGFYYAENTFNYIPLILAITNDLELTMTGKPCKETLAELKIFRDYFKPQVVKTGYHFNIREFVNAYEIYIDYTKSPTWRENNKSFFGVNVIGFLERLLPAPFLQRVCQGFVKPDKTLHRCFDVKHYLVKRTTVSIHPLDQHTCLGKDFFIDDLGQAGRAATYATYGARENIVKFLEIPKALTECMNYQVSTPCMVM